MAKLNDLEVEDYLAACVQVEPLALQEEFVRWASDYSFWNERFSKASRLHAGQKLERERCEAQISMAVRSASTKATVGEVEARVKLDPEYKKFREAELDAEVEAERINGVLQALRGKKDMLVQMGYHQRAEMAGDPVLREYARDQRAGS